MGSTSPLRCALRGDDVLFFLHIPKTAGTSLNYLIENNFGFSEVWHDRIYTHFHRFIEQVSKRPKYIGGHVFHDLMRIALGEEFMSATIVRDPVERFVSNFWHAKRSYDNPSNVFNVERFKDITLAEYLADNQLMSEINFANAQYHYLAARFDATRLRDHPDVRELGQAVEADRNLEQVGAALSAFAYLGVAECFRESMDVLAYTFGWVPWSYVPFLMVYPDREQRGAVSPSMLERLRAMNAREVELYEYARRCFEERYAEMIGQLVECYGQDCEAPVDSGLPRSVLHQLLEKHYDRCFAARHPVVEGATVDFARSISGTGWYPAEPDAEGGTFRWMGPRPVSTLDLRLARDRDLRVRLRVHGAVNDRQLSGLTLEVNAHPVPLEARRHSDAAPSFEGLVPRSALITGRSYVRLTIRVSHTLPQSTIDRAAFDDRLLGVAVKQVDLEPK